MWCIRLWGERAENDQANRSDSHHVTNKRLPWYFELFLSSPPCITTPLGCSIRLYTKGRQAYISVNSCIMHVRIDLVGALHRVHAAYLAEVLEGGDFNLIDDRVWHSVVAIYSHDSSKKIWILRCWILVAKMPYYILNLGFLPDRISFYGIIIPFLTIALMVNRYLVWSRLRHIPGPRFAPFSNLWKLKLVLSGRMPEVLNDVSETYG